MARAIGKATQDEATPTFGDEVDAKADDLRAETELRCSERQPIGLERSRVYTVVDAFSDPDQVRVRVTI